MLICYVCRKPNELLAPSPTPNLFFANEPLENESTRRSQPGLICFLRYTQQSLIVCRYS